MRSLSTILLALFGFFAINHAQAQTWTKPIPLAYTLTQFLSGNTCEASDTIDFYDGWPATGPDIVYQLRNRQPVGSLHFSSAIITLVPSTYYSSLDFEIFACQAKYGNSAYNCPIEADNIDQLGQPFQVAIPNQYETFNIIVTAANMYESGYNNPCA